jgi:hypothetical protein
MEGLDPRCCGLDSHQKTVVACLLTTEAGMVGPFDGVVMKWTGLFPIWLR